jgi:Icc-related predicted phosphoesterase
MGGDLTGKMIVPVIKEGDKYYANFKGNRFKASDEKELEQVFKELRFRAAYPVVLTRDEVEEIRSDQSKVEELFKEVTVKEIEHLVSLLEVFSKDHDIILTPGNDDIFDIDDVIRRSDKIIYPLKRVVEFPLGYEMISMDYTTPTPWNTPRECSEKELWKKLKKEADRIDTGWKKVICNFHEPPYGTSIDLAPKLDENLQPVYKLGELETEHVGSKSVLKFMKEYKPLLGLHGHIHEAPGYDKIGDTMIFNPGSEYQYGELKALIFDLDREGVKNWFKIG